MTGRRHVILVRTLYGRTYGGTLSVHTVECEDTQPVLKPLCLEISPDYTSAPACMPSAVLVGAVQTDPPQCTFVHNQGGDGPDFANKPGYNCCPGPKVNIIFTPAEAQAAFCSLECKGRRRLGPHGSHTSGISSDHVAH